MAKDGRQTNQKKERYWTGAHTTHKLRYHLVFVPKYRKRVLQGKVAARLEQLLRQACSVNRWSLEELAIQPDPKILSCAFDGAGSTQMDGARSLLCQAKNASCGALPPIRRFLRQKLRFY